MLLLPLLTVMAKVMGKGFGVHDQLSHTNAAEPQRWARHRRIEPPHLRTSETDEGDAGCEMLTRRYRCDEPYRKRDEGGGGYHISSTYPRPLRQSNNDSFQSSYSPIHMSPHLKARPTASKPTPFNQVRPTNSQLRHVYLPHTGTKPATGAA
jgi:hypothetical protein